MRLKYPYIGSPGGGVMSTCATPAWIGAAEREGAASAASRRRQAPRGSAPAAAGSRRCAGSSLKVLRVRLQPPEHLVDPYQGVVEHLLGGSDIEPRRRVGSAVAAPCGRADCRHVSERSVGIAEEKTIAHRAARAPLHLKVDEGLAGHRDERNLLVYEDGRDRQLILRLRVLGDHPGAFRV